MPGIGAHDAMGRFAGACPSPLFGDEEDMPRSAFEEMIADAAMNAEAPASPPAGARVVLAAVDNLYTVPPTALASGGKWSATIEIDSPVADTPYTILTDHDEDLTVTAAIQQSVGASAGTLAFRANGDAIAGLGSVAVGTTKSTTAPTSGVQVIPAGARVDVVPTGITGVTRLTLTLRGTK